MHELIDIVARLRAPDGCPWDKQQTAQSLRAFVVEEAYEVVHAIERDDDLELQQELGDLLFLVTMLSQLAAERGAFSFDDVVDAISTKMKRRHPHVFGTKEQLAQGHDPARWEAIKADERGPHGSALDGVPTAMPALLRAQALTHKASAVGFDWPDRSGPRAKIDEELAELDHALLTQDSAAIEHELGDVLLSVVNLARFVPTSAEDALRGASSRFQDRFRHIEATLDARGERVHEVDLQTLDALWNHAKEQTR